MRWQSVLAPSLVGFLCVPPAQPTDPKPPEADADYVKVEVRGTLTAVWEHVADEGKNQGKKVFFAELSLTSRTRPKGYFRWIMDLGTEKRLWETARKLKKKKVVVTGELVEELGPRDHGGAGHTGPPWPPFDPRIRVSALRESEK